MAFRTLRELDKPQQLRKKKSYPFLLVKKNGEIMRGVSKLEKDEVVMAFENGDRLFVAWPFKYITEFFELTPENLKKHYK